MVEFNQYDFQAEVANFPFEYTPATRDDERKIQEAIEADKREDQLLAEDRDPNGELQQMYESRRDANDLNDYILKMYKQGAAKGVAVVEKRGQEVFEKMNEHYQRAHSKWTEVVHKFNEFSEIHSDCEDIMTERNEALEKNSQLEAQIKQLNKQLGDHEMIISERNKALKKKNKLKTQCKQLRKQVKDHGRIVSERDETLEKNSQLEAQCKQLRKQLEDHGRIVSERDEVLERNNQVSSDMDKTAFSIPQPAEQLRLMTTEEEEVIKDRDQWKADCMKVLSKAQATEKNLREANKALEDDLASKVALIRDMANLLGPDHESPCG
ncbi:uncharacterized protein N0V89_012294 [Didymosphaeria variabile]|uniref:Uncharacterized protein n=1 Tax=Didymosphaeria variabile TaxID=1932322 RepID=A0A9W9C600_9PLEO|nr:uncharacterized protein N0V89_012294 [Didymosphaeria variabile]KAJ4344550.1 hypothetical protein N0V89_012294 [Didymosphaeria variabile]